MVDVPLEVVQAIIDSEPVAFTVAYKYPVAKVIFGGREALNAGFEDEMGRTECIIATTDWDIASRRHYAITPRSLKTELTWPRS